MRRSALAAALLIAALAHASQAGAHERLRSETGARLAWPQGNAGRAPGEAAGQGASAIPGAGRQGCADAVHVPVSLDSARDAGVDVAALERALATWESTGCVQFALAEDERHAIRIERQELPAEQSTLAASTDVDSDRPRSGVIDRARIVLNAARIHEVDLESVLLHELGHALGLAHSRVRKATMAAGVKPGEIERELGADDVAGVCAIYRSPSR